MLRLHYVPAGHGSHDFSHRGQNAVTVAHRRGTGSTNVARRGCRDRRDRFLKLKKFAMAATAGLTYLMCRSRMGRTQQNMTERNRP